MNDPNLHLFFDDVEIQHYINLERVLTKPSRLPDPIVSVDRPWEGDHAQAWGSVVRETDGRFRMFYFAFNTSQRAGEEDRGGYALAESIDGRHWTKPELGVVGYKGSTANNLWYTFAPDGNNIFDRELARRGLGLPATDENGDVIGVVNNMDGHTVILDPEDPDPMRRYKLIANMQDHRMWAEAYRDYYMDTTTEEIAHARTVMGQYLDTSPDGVHWTRRLKRLLPMRYGDYMMVTRDERNKRWWLNERALNVFGRNAALRTSSDLIEWSDPAEMAYFNQPDSASAAATSGMAALLRSTMATSTSASLRSGATPEPATRASWCSSGKASPGSGSARGARSSTWAPAASSTICWSTQLITHRSRWASGSISSTPGVRRTGWICRWG